MVCLLRLPSVGALQAPPMEFGPAAFDGGEADVAAQLQPLCPQYPAIRASLLLPSLGTSSDLLIVNKKSLFTCYVLFNIQEMFRGLSTTWRCNYCGHI